MAARSLESLVDYEAALEWCAGGMCGACLFERHGLASDEKNGQDLYPGLGE